VAGSAQTHGRRARTRRSPALCACSAGGRVALPVDCHWHRDGGLSIYRRRFRPRGTRGNSRGTRGYSTATASGRGTASLSGRGTACGLAWPRAGRGIGCAQRYVRPMGTQGYSRGTLDTEGTPGALRAALASLSGLRLAAGRERRLSAHLSVALPSRGPPLSSPAVRPTTMPDSRAASSSS
jgi:hypothetical protein